MLRAHALATGASTCCRHSAFLRGSVESKKRRFCARSGVVALDWLEGRDRRGGGTGCVGVGRYGVFFRPGDVGVGKVRVVCVIRPAAGARVLAPRPGGSRRRSDSICSRVASDWCGSVTGFKDRDGVVSITRTIPMDGSGELGSLTTVIT